jgi:hypothetical protein
MHDSHLHTMQVVVDRVLDVVQVNDWMQCRSILMLVDVNADGVLDVGIGCN